MERWGGAEAGANDPHAGPPTSSTDTSSCMTTSTEPGRLHEDEEPDEQNDPPGPDSIAPQRPPPLPDGTNATQHTVGGKATAQGARSAQGDDGGGARATQGAGGGGDGQGTAQSAQASQGAQASQSGEGGGRGSAPPPAQPEERAGASAGKGYAPPQAQPDGTCAVTHPVTKAPPPVQSAVPGTHIAPEPQQQQDQYWS